MKTFAELAKAWHAEFTRTAKTEGAGNLNDLDRQIVEAQVVTAEDTVALLGVVIADFRGGHENNHGELELADDGQAMVWKALNAAHAILNRGLVP